MPTPAQVARKANVTPQTIRNYSTQYGEFLSPEARGENGPRVYNDADVEILCAIASLRNSGLSTDEVIERLRNQEVPPIVDVTPQPPLNEPQEALNAGQGELLAPQPVQFQMQRDEVVYSRLDAIDTVNEMIREQLVTMRQEQKDRVNYGVTMLIIGAAGMLVAVALATLLN